MFKTKITDLHTYLPERVVPNDELEALLNRSGPLLPAGSLERLFGIRERRFAAPHEQTSDLAVAAARPLLEQHGTEEIDFLVFASACSDLIEPATCNIVQHKLGLRCPAMDVKNACNSFVTGLLVASGLIATGQCRRVLVVTGEKLSDAIRFQPDGADQLRRSLAAYSLGDAGAAALLSRSDDGNGIEYQRFMTVGEHWELCTIKGGGSLNPHSPVDVNYFEGQTAALREVIFNEGMTFVGQCLQEANWAPSDIQHLFTHQVSVGTFQAAAGAFGLRADDCEQVFVHCGNTAAASIPLAMHQALRDGRLQRGDRVALLGLAAGISLSVQLLTW